jgi:hypothetical protein
VLQPTDLLSNSLVVKLRKEATLVSINAGKATSFYFLFFDFPCMVTPFSVSAIVSADVFSNFETFVLLLLVCDNAGHRKTSNI